MLLNTLHRQMRHSRRMYSKMESLNVFSTIDSPKYPYIHKCRKDGFLIGNVNLRGGVALINGSMFLWDVQKAEDLKREHLALVELAHPHPELLLLGTGSKMVPLPGELIKTLQDLGIQYETMTSRTACSTWNVMIEEDRNVAALLLPLEPVSARELNSPEEKKD